MTDFVIPDNWPIWLGVLAALVKLYQKDLAAMLPSALRDHLAHRARMKTGLQEHNQEIEEVSIEALAQSSVTNQMQLINVNRQLVEFLTSQIDSRLTDIEQVLATVREQSIKGQAQSSMVQVEWSRVVDTLTRTERLLQSLEAWLNGNGISEDNGAA